MGQVFLAEQRSLKRAVALKILRQDFAESPRQLERFLNEARLAASMNHPNLIAVFGVGEENDLHYIAMEYVRGPSVMDVLRERKMIPLVEACRIVMDTAAGLQAAWDKRGIVHCDIKPENILLPQEGGVKIADMGLAEGLATVSEDSGGNSFAGSPYYVCPEIILGRPLDHRSDLYSLGATFFEMVTGRPPYEGNDLTEVAGRHLYDTPPDPRQYVPDLPLAACNVIGRLLKKDPSERYQCADELNQALQVEVLLSRATRDTSSSGIRAAAAPSRWKCPSCGRLNGESSRYCLDCGAYGWHPCPLCGEDIPINALFCTHCGGNLIEQRHGVIRQAQHLLQQMHEAVHAMEYDQAGEYVAEFHKLDQAVLPELDRSRFQDILTHLSSVLEKDVHSAREELNIDRLEASTTRLLRIFGIEGYGWLKKEVDQLKSDLAQAVYEAGAAYKSNCLSTCRGILSELPNWHGGTIGDRLHELAEAADKRIVERDQAIKDAQAVVEAAATDYGDAVLASWHLVSFRISRKILIVTPDEVDSAADAHSDMLAAGLRQLVYEGVERWVAEEQWEALADLLSALRNCEGTYLLDQEKYVADCVKNEIQARHQAALEAEKDRDIRRALDHWDRVLQVPVSLLPRQIRREAVAFPARRCRLLEEQRRPLLKSNLSVVFFLWCFVFAVGVYEVAAAWLFEPETFEWTLVRDYTVPFVVQLVAIGLFSRLLSNQRVLSSGELVPRRHPPVFLSGIILLWILSPLNGAVTMVLHHAARLIPGFEAAGHPWVAPLVVMVLWLAFDLNLFVRYCSPFMAGSIVLSWIFSLVLLMGLWGSLPTTPLLQVGATMYQAVFFLLFQVCNFWWWHRRKATIPIHPALATTHC